MRSSVAVILLAFVQVSIGEAQARVLPDVGARVRVTSAQIPRGRTVGILGRITRDTVVVTGHAVSLASISRFELSAGRKSKWLTGMGTGFLGGAALGALSGVIACRRTEIPGYCALVLGGIGGGAGLVVGGILGASMQGDRWREVPLSAFRMAPILGPRGTLGIAVSVSF